MNDISLINNNIPAGEGTKASPYLMANAAQLDWFRDQVNGGRNSIHGALVADITYNAGMDVEGFNGEPGQGITEFTPIAPGGEGYHGTFDGRGNTISGIYVNWYSSPSCGLFGIVGTGGVVKDVTVRNSCFKNCHDEGKSMFLGGIAGICLGAVTGCTFMGRLDVHGYVLTIYCGGVAGYVYGTVSGCASSCDVDVRGKALASIYCGGIAGCAVGPVTDCTSSGTTIVSGDAKTCICCGGIAGKVYGALAGCKSCGGVDASGTSPHIHCGGITGDVNGTGAVTGCAFTGSVGISGAAKSACYGRIAGHFHRGTVKNCAG